MVSKPIVTCGLFLTVVFLYSCAPAVTYTNDNTNKVEITNMNENRLAIIENENLNGQGNVTAKKIPLSPTTEAPEGCEWEEAIFSQIRFLQYNCSSDTVPLTFTERGSNLYSNSDASYPVIEMFTKNVGETNEDAVLRIASAKATKPTNCTVLSARYGVTREGADRYEYALTDTAAESFAEAYPDVGLLNEDCGTYGVTNGVQYFEFQDNRDMFFFIRLGQDTPGIDFNGIEIGMNN